MKKVALIILSLALFLILPNSASAAVYKLIPPERLTTWTALRDTNHLIWQDAVRICNLTGTSAERYWDIGMWCSIIAVTNDDSVAAAKAIAKLRQISATARPNTIREEFIGRVLETDMLSKWLTPSDRAVIDPVLDSWDKHVATLRRVDSDAFVGEGCGAILWDKFNGRVPNYPNVISELSRYIGETQGGQWVESSQYNMGTLTLLGMCNLAMRTVTGQDIVPGVSQFLVEAGTIAAIEVTPDFKQAIQWADDQYPRDFIGRLYRRSAFLAGLPSPEAQWTLQQLMNRYWPFSASSLMQYGLFLWRTDIPPQPLPTTTTAVANGVGMVYRRDGNILEWAMAKNTLGADHSDYAAPFDIQVYNNGWFLTHPIAYYGLMSGELMPNGPVYAGLSYFRDMKMTWTASGTNWTAISGEAKGPYSIVGYPPPPPFLRYGGRVVVTATVNGEPVVIARDEVDMDDPRTLSGWPSGYRENSIYQHQSRINEFNGKMWAIWHAPQQPVMNGSDLSWTAPNGAAVTLRSFSDTPIQVVLKDEQTVFGRDVTIAEKKWQARIHTDAPVLFQVFSASNQTVSRVGDTITVGGQSWTINKNGVTSSNGPVPSPTPPVTPPQTPPSTRFSVGDKVVTTGSNVNVRNTASISGTSIGTLPMGTLGTVVGGSTSADGYFWWNINYDNTAIDGWSSENFLTKYIPPTLPPPPITPPPTTTPPPQTTPVNSTKFVVGDNVITNDGARVRAQASPSATILGIQPIRTVGKILGGGISVGGYFWWNVNYDGSSIDGWTAEGVLAKSSVATPPPPLAVPIVTLSVNPTTGVVGIINPMLTWSATNSPSSCTASGNWSGEKDASGKNVAQGILTIAKTYTYTLKCFNTAGESLPMSATVTISEPIKEETTPATPSRANIVWTSLENTSPSGNTVTKTGTTLAWDAAAKSNQSIISGDVYMEFVATRAYSELAAGLSNDNFSITDKSINIAIALTKSGGLRCRANGVSLAVMNGNLYKAGDVFRVSYENGVGKCYQNGILKASTAMKIGYPIFAKTALFTPGATVGGAVFGATSSSNPANVIASSSKVPNLLIVGLMLVLAIIVLRFRKVIFK